MAKTITVYGIKNCDTMKKARAWLEKHGVGYVFHDYKTEAIERERSEQWCKKVGGNWPNRAGTTFRKPPESDKARVDARKAMQLMLEQPSMIKRPVLGAWRRQAGRRINPREGRHDGASREVMTRSPTDIDRSNSAISVPFMVATEPLLAPFHRESLPIVAVSVRPGFTTRARNKALALGRRQHIGFEPTVSTAASAGISENAA